MTTFLSSLLFFFFVNSLLSQEAFDENRDSDHFKPTVLSQQLVDSFGGMTDYGARCLREKKKKKHGSSEKKQSSAERRGETPNFNNYNAAIPLSPCGKKFQYLTDGREWQGSIKLKNVEIEGDTLVEADFVLPRGLNQQVT